MQASPQTINEIQNMSDGPTIIIIMLLLILTYVMALFERI